jgi:TatD DNase family protein
MTTPPLLFDTHMHLNYFPDSHGDVVQSALDAGVEKMMTVATSLELTDLLQSYADLYPCVYYSVGQHPHDAKDLTIEVEGLREKLILLHNHPKMIAYGETGLDYHYNHSPKEIQIASFRAHIEAGITQNLPIIVHTREAEEDTMAILGEYRGQGLRGIIHCFSGTQKLADFSIEQMGFFISFSGIITFPKASEIQEVAAKAPLEFVLIETDSPFLAPVPHRGKQNEPMHVRHVYNKLCALRPGEDPATIAVTLRENTRRLLGV